jgi:hypothetical protein
MKRSVLSILMAGAVLSACATLAPVDDETSASVEPAAATDVPAATEEDEGQGGGERVGN